MYESRKHDQFTRPKYEYPNQREQSFDIIDYVSIHFYFWLSSLATLALVSYQLLLILSVYEFWINFNRK